MESGNESTIINNSRFNVLIRLRPVLGDERDDFTTDEDLYQCVTRMSNKEIKLTRPMNEELRIFEFDNILGQEVTQDEAYDRIARGIINDVMEGYNGTIMAYGQTGSGKSYTIFGKKNSLEGKQINADMGIVPRAIKQIFEYINSNSNKAQFQVRIAFMQIYMEQISDLIPDDESENTNNAAINNPMIFNSKKKSNFTVKDGLQIREDPKTGIFVKGLKQIRVGSEEELLNLIKYGSKFRITGATSMNKTSSRSHAILQILVEQKRIENEGEIVISKTGDTIPQIKKRRYKKGLLTIVDLAGSERISKSGSEGLRLEEAKKINLSISSLGNCINALANNVNMQHVPFRESKLTRILTECLGGNSKTSICACISPFLMNYDETFTTLQFASRAIKIKVDAHINEKVEMKKLQDKLIDFAKIKQIESMMKGVKKKESTSESMPKRSINIQNMEEEAPNGNSNDNSHQRSKSPDNSNRINKSSIQNNSMIQNNNNNSYYLNNEKEDYATITKKFHSLVLHLQGELAKSILTIHSLQEENRSLKERLTKHY